MGSNERHHSDLLARILGILVFLLGIGLLCGVFYWAFGMFQIKPDALLGLTFTDNPKTSPTLEHIGTQFGALLLHIGILFVMAIAGSLISQRGINLYFSALKGMPVEVAAKAPAPPPAEQLPSS